MIRFFCLNAFIVIHSILFCLWAILLSLFDNSGRLVRLYSSAPWSKMILWVCGVKVRVKGRENFPADGPYVFMSNHQSYFDIFALLAYLPADFKFIMKKELMKVPLLGLAMRRAGYIGIERDNPKEAIRSMDKVVKMIKRGISFLIFPEGTRSIDGRLRPLKKGGFNLAIKSGCDIVPVAISDSYRIVTKGSLKINKGSFYIYFGKPISVKGYSRENMSELMDCVREAILNMLNDSNTSADIHAEAIG